MFGHISKELAKSVSMVSGLREINSPMSFKQIRMNPELHTSLHLQYHIGSRIIISLEKVCLIWGVGSHLPGRRHVMEEKSEMCYVDVGGEN